MNYSQPLRSAAAMIFFQSSVPRPILHHVGLFSVVELWSFSWSISRDSQVTDFERSATACTVGFAFGLEAAIFFFNSSS